MMVTDLKFNAIKAWYEKGSVCILFDDGKEIRFSVALNEKLRNALEKMVANIELSCGDTGLHWPELDEDLSILGILEGRYGKGNNTFV